MTKAIPARTTRDLPLGPQSWSWTYSGDWRVLLAAPWIGLVQLAHPGLGAGVEQHSAFYTEPWARLFRSIPQIGSVMFDTPRATDEGLRVRDLHTTIKGTDSAGRRYHALDPATFYWAHATISEGVAHTVRVFDHEMSEDERDLHFHESATVYRRYQVSDRAQPETLPAYRDYLSRNFSEVLERTPAVTAFIDMANNAGDMAQPWMPQPLWKMIAPLVRSPMWTLGVGMLDPATRDTLELRWTKTDQRRLNLVANTVRAAWPAVPNRLRYMKVARTAFAREGWPSVPRPAATTWQTRARHQLATLTSAG